MNMFDEARALSDMLKMRGMTQSEIADSLGVSQSYVANKIRLQRLPEAVKEEIVKKGLCERQARQLLRLGCEENMLSLIEEICERKMTVAESEVAVDRIRSFEKFIDEALMSLSSVGISADKSIEIHNCKKYITILINET